MSRSIDDVLHHAPKTLLGRWTTDPDQVADDLEAAGWPSVADDVRDGLDPDTILSRLYAIGEDESSSAVAIVAYAAA